jgi:hypothetical protein
VCVEVSFGHVVSAEPDQCRCHECYRNTHQHMLWAFGNTTIDFQEVRAFESREAKASEKVTKKFNESMVVHLQIVLKITVVDDSRIAELRVSAFTMTTLCVSFDIMPASFPFFAARLTTNAVRNSSWSLCEGWKWRYESEDKIIKDGWTWGSET